MAKLTMAEVRWIPQHAGLGYWQDDVVVAMAQALIESQQALRSGCLGCSRGWKLDLTNPLRLHEIPTRDAGFYKLMGGYFPCGLNAEQRAALLLEDDDDNESR